ncbi:MAG: mechanosensitive ion channel domain-containing protein [Myxococcota bacterium]
MDLDKVKTALVELVAVWGLRIVGLLLALFAGWIVAGALSRNLVRQLEARSFDPTLAKFFGSLVRWLVVVATVLGCLGAFGIQTASFAAVIASAGLAVGLAFQGTLSNFAAGVMLLVFRPFRVGDFVETAGTSGTVVEIELFTTELKGADARKVVVPNTKIFADVITNFSASPVRRTSMDIGVAYDADLDGTRRVILEAVRSVDLVLDDPEPTVFLRELGDNAVVWNVRAWSKNPDYWAMHEQVMRAVKYALDDEKIGIPFPQMDLHVVEAKAPLVVVNESKSEAKV